MKVNNERLKDNINTLEKSHDWPVGLVEKLSRFISDGNDYDLFRINPLQFADEYHISSSDGIDLFLWATKLNLFQMNFILNSAPNYQNMDLKEFLFMLDLMNLYFIKN